MNRELKNDIEMQEDIYNLLLNSELPSIISGGIYKFTRPIDSSKEDVVIGTLYINAKQLQTGIFNINIHVSNLPAEISENPAALDTAQPNIERIQEIGAAAVCILQKSNPFDFSLKLVKPGVIEGYQLDWFYNIQVEYTRLTN